VLYFAVTINTILTLMIVVANRWHFIILLIERYHMSLWLSHTNISINGRLRQISTVATGKQLVTKGLHMKA